MYSYPPQVFLNVKRAVSLQFMYVSNFQTDSCMLVSLVFYSLDKLF